MKPAGALDRRLSTSSDQPGVASTTCIRRLPDGANSGKCYQSTTAISELPTMPLSDHRMRALAPGEQEGPPGVHPRVHGRTARRGRPLAQLVSAPAAPPSTRRRPVTNGPMKSVLLLTQLRTPPLPCRGGRSQRRHRLDRGRVGTGMDHAARRVLLVAQLHRRDYASRPNRFDVERHPMRQLRHPLRHQRVGVRVAGEPPAAVRRHAWASGDRSRADLGEAGSGLLPPRGGRPGRGALRRPRPGAGRHADCWVESEKRRIWVSSAAGRPINCDQHSDQDRA
jgi:hypothetical protein